MQHFLPTVHAILSQPTAPFHEDAVRRAILEELAGLPGVTVELDAFDNVVARYAHPESAAGAPRYAMAAHMDHPGFVGKEFLGGVPKEVLAKKAPTKKFGAFSMWDLEAVKERAGRIYSRACDDLIGCACIVAMLRELSDTGAKTSVLGLFSRAEEVGFVGAMKLAESGLIPAETTVVSLETSSLKGGPVKLGAGVIIRVGDRTSIFDAEATAQLQACAKEAELPHQRALMQGGTCEATAYALYGYRVAALCVALGNYHNVSPSQTIAPEYVSATDATAMAQLCVALAKSGPATAGGALGALKKRLEKNLREHRKYFRALDGEVSDGKKKAPTRKKAKK